MPVHTPSSGAVPHRANQYDISLAIIFGTPLRMLYGNHTMAVLESDFAAQGIQGLLGRDVLSRSLLIYDGATGIFTLSF